ncbi:hypothetical protein P171DRAFT_443280 [Karstenula rhodostoma CBS 690.94]|uniref:Uncharacterized protein n=1 Tax=Karstenula rhodostoma CBS 690.94 TaxID=1392251 RepID=A0A9P4PLT5_9PLEO|nr:hypothetical protein P171DRAFT_443280 [Karstenula rhodostoma CBS 690.94]
MHYFHILKPTGPLELLAGMIQVGQELTVDAEIRGRVYELVAAGDGTPINIKRRGMYRAIANMWAATASQRTFFEAAVTSASTRLAHMLVSHMSVARSARSFCQGVVRVGVKYDDLEAWLKTFWGETKPAQALKIRFTDYNRKLNSNIDLLPLLSAHYGINTSFKVDISFEIEDPFKFFESTTLDDGLSERERSFMASTNVKVPSSHKNEEWLAMLRDSPCIVRKIYANPLGYGYYAAKVVFVSSEIGFLTR